MTPTTGSAVEWEIVPATEATIDGRTARGDFYLVQYLEKRNRGRGQYTKKTPAGTFFTLGAAKSWLVREHGVDLRTVRIRDHTPPPLANAPPAPPKLEPRPSAELALDPPKGLARSDDRATAVAAGEAIAEHRSKLQKKVLEAFRRDGPMTDPELEALEEFSGYAYSTVRKRRQELVQKGELEDSGGDRKSRQRRDGDRPARAAIWRAVS